MLEVKYKRDTEVSLKTMCNNYSRHKNGEIEFLKKLRSNRVWIPLNVGDNLYSCISLVLLSTLCLSDFYMNGNK